MGGEQKMQYDLGVAYTTAIVPMVAYCNDGQAATKLEAEMLKVFGGETLKRGDAVKHTVNFDEVKGAYEEVLGCLGVTADQVAPDEFELEKPKPTKEECENAGVCPDVNNCPGPSPPDNEADCLKNHDTLQKKSDCKTCDSGCADLRVGFILFLSLVGVLRQ